MPTDWIETAYSALVASLKGSPLGDLVRVANLIAFDGPNPFPEMRARAPGDAVRVIVEPGEFRDNSPYGVMPSAGNCVPFDSFTQIFAIKIVGPDRRSKPVTAALAALRFNLRTVVLPKGAYVGEGRWVPMAANSPEFNGSALRGLAGVVPIVFNMPRSLE